MNERGNAEKRQALTAALETARRRGRLRECADLGALREAAAPFFPFGRQPSILRTWIHQPGGCYVLAVVPPSPSLIPGEWHAGPVTVDGRDGIAVVLVVDAGIAREVEGRPLPPVGLRESYGRWRRLEQ